MPHEANATETDEEGEPVVQPAPMQPTGTTGSTCTAESINSKNVGDVRTVQNEPRYVLRHRNHLGQVS